MIGERRVDQVRKTARCVSAPLAIGSLLLVVFGDLLLRDDGYMVSHRMGDGTRFFVYLRDFGFSELRSGNLPLWNPHLFSGTPFVGGFQAAMLYPPTWVHLFLPIATGIDFEAMFHVGVLAAGTYLWARGRQLSVAASLVAATVAAFGAPTSLRVLAGALSVLATYAWTPWLLASVDALARRFDPAWALVGTGAAAMTLLAGHPPTALMSATVVGLYALPALWQSRQRLRLSAALAGMAAVGTLLAGFQLATGFDAASESIRRSGLDYEFATNYSFPPENLLTFLIPSLFGDVTAQHVSYHGRWFFWDDVAFIGAAGCVLVLIGACFGRSPGRRTAMGLFALLVFLALGRYTPIYRLAYMAVPGFDLLRAPSKLMFYASLFLALLAGIGAQRLSGGGTTPDDPPLPIRGLSAGVGLTGVLVLGFGLWTRLATNETSPVTWLAQIDTSRVLGREEFEAWRNVAGAGMSLSGAVLVTAAVALRLSIRHRRAGWLVAVLCVAELVVFARVHRGGVPWNLGIALRGPAVASAIEAAGDARVLEVGVGSNAPMAVRGHAIWGYDSLVLDRYSRFIAYTQGRTPAQLDNVRGRAPDRVHPLLRLARLEIVVDPRTQRVVRLGAALPRFGFASDYVIATEPEAILDIMASDGFDLDRTAVLEQEPIPAPDGRPPNASVEVITESTDRVALEVRLDRPALLVMTDAYSRDWRATPLPGSVQKSYRVQPADLAFRAIALEGGLHRLELEYVPAHARVGLAATSLGGVIYLGGLGAWLASRRSGSA